MLYAYCQKKALDKKWTKLKALHLHYFEQSIQTHKAHTRTQARSAFR